MIAVILNVKSDEIGAKQAFQQFALPGADSKGFWVWPRDVPEDADSRVGAALLDHEGQKGEVVVLNNDDRVLRFGHFFDDGVSEFFVNLLILLPVGGAEDRSRVGDVT